MSPVAACSASFRPGQVAEGNHVGKIYFGRLDQALAHVGKVWPQDDHLEGGLQDRQPGFRRIEGDVEISGQLGYVEEPGALGGQGPKKILEEAKITDLP